MDERATEGRRLPPERIVVLAGAALAGALVLVVACISTSGHPDGEVLERGVASWYGPDFHGRTTANGERYDMHGLTAAHRTLPFGTELLVRNLDNGRTCRVRVNDRGPFVRNRILDLSYGAARELGMVGPGTARVELVLLGDGEAPASGEPEVRRVARRPEARYTVQVGAFRERERALRLRELLTARFPEAEVRSGDGWHRVQVGEFRKRRAAEELAEELRRLGWEATLVAAR
ncbi:MAG: septal ring lytic transglycosylase RlpA family protein [Thermoanaerobaculia bacterium]